MDARRRRFLLTTSAAALGHACGTSSAADAGVMDTGQTVGQLPVGAFFCPPGGAPGQYILARDAQGFYAYSNTCTHAGCAVPCPDAQGTSVCPCHGSRFDQNGDIQSGADGGQPMQPSLPHYRVTFRGTGPSAVILVDTGMELLDRRRRVPPP